MGQFPCLLKINGAAALRLGAEELGAGTAGNAVVDLHGPPFEYFFGEERIGGIGGRFPPCRRSPSLGSFRMSFFKGRRAFISEVD